MTSTIRGVLLALLAFGIFATHDALIKGLGQSYSVFQIVFFSVLFGFPPIALAMGTSRALNNFVPHHPWWLLARTVLIVIGMGTAFYAFSTLPLAEAYAILFSMPLLVTILSVPFLGEKIGLRRGTAIVIGMIGVLIVLRPGGSELQLGHASALIAAVAAALGAIIIRKIGPDERSTVLVLYPMFANLLMMACLLPFTYVPMPLHHMGQAALVGILAFCGQMVMVSAFKAASPSVVAPMQYSQIIWATVYGAIFFNEIPDNLVFLGAAIVIGSGLYIVWRESGDQVSEVKPVLTNANPRRDAGPSPNPKRSKSTGISLRF